VGRWGNTSFDVHVAGTAGGRDVFTAVVVYVSVVPVKHTPTPVPGEVREALSR
jgi:acyl-CoA thioesterase FadM